MIYYGAVAVLALGSLVLYSVFPQILGSIWATPDILLILAVFNAMFRGPVHGGGVAFLLGLLEDLFFGRFIGLNALAKGVAGLLVGMMAKSTYRENMWVPVINVFFGSLLSLAIVYIMGHLAGARWYFSVIIEQSFLEVLFTVCLVPFLYGPYFHFADKQLHLREEL